ncbi:putative glucose ABC transporter permease protein TsgC13 [Candidatus Terasakiella magnetica]|uniref:Putative glucose ABC transporter permease protein TsgC13 n=1 Tax=Candidatus Terasakiella magnetica TaxID=1867952 RepID=A0A1C3RFY6_9PROT|nr:ABC transporter permease [Candidatus Terasakiella magnetica]SCA56175.1 putative glucose ABC transporter permease protein TsgC13 [Candidatus Terasakiella magnetica]
MTGFELETIIAILLGVARGATPLVFAAIGELITEKAGVLNLGVEGMMLVGAVAGFVCVVATGSTSLGFLAAILAGALLSSLFAILVLFLHTNQVASGLALTIFGIGLSAFFGLEYVGTPIKGLSAIHIAGLSDIPVIGPLLFGHDIMVYLAFVLVGLCIWFLNKSRWGLILRAVGESHHAAHAIGYPVIAIRFAAILFGGGMCGLAGAYISLIYTPMWAENMTAGRGWIALALVVFATWKPGRALIGAYLFGGVTILQLNVQSMGVDISAHLMNMLPYIATILVLVLISRDESKIRHNAPACLGKPFRADG